MTFRPEPGQVVVTTSYTRRYTRHVFGWYKAAWPIGGVWQVSAMQTALYRTWGQKVRLATPEEEAAWRLGATP